MADIHSFGIKDVVLPQAVRDFRPRCPGCTPANVSSDGARPCSFYDCPGLPAELQVTCDLCMYDFSIHEGQPKCDHNLCETALRLQANVETFRKWVQLLRDEGSSQ